MSPATIARAPIHGKDWVPLVWVKPIGSPIGVWLSKSEEDAIANSWLQITFRGSEGEVHPKLDKEARRWLPFCQNLTPSVQIRTSVPPLSLPLPRKPEKRDDKQGESSGAKQKEPSLSSSSRSPLDTPAPSGRTPQPTGSPGHLFGSAHKYTPSPPLPPVTATLASMPSSLPTISHAATPAMQPTPSPALQPPQASMTTSTPLHLPTPSLLTPPPPSTHGSAATPTLQTTPSPTVQPPQPSMTPSISLPPPLLPTAPLFIRVAPRSIPIHQEKSPLLLAILIDQFVKAFNRKYDAEETFQGTQQSQCATIFSLFEAVINPQKKEARELAKPFHLFRLNIRKWMHLYDSMIKALEETLGKDALSLSSWSHGIHSLFSKVSLFIKVPPTPPLVFVSLDPPPKSTCPGCIIS